MIARSGCAIFVYWQSKHAKRGDKSSVACTTLCLVGSRGSKKDSDISQPIGDYFASGYKSVISAQSQELSGYDLLTTTSFHRIAK